MWTTRSKSFENLESCAIGQVSEGVSKFFILEMEMIEPRSHESGKMPVARELMVFIS